MEKRHHWRMRAPRVNPLAGCLAAALAVGAGAPAFAAATHAHAFARDPSALHPDAIAAPPPRRGSGLLDDAARAHAREILSRPPPPVPAGAVVVVSNCDDGGTGSLRAAVNAAPEGATIDMTSLSCSTITLSSGAIVAGQDNLTLDGPGALDLAVDGQYDQPVFVHVGSGTLAVNGLAVIDGYKYQASTTSVAAKGGCIYSAGSVSLSNASVKYCTAESASATYGARGAGIYAIGGVSLTDSIVSGNVAKAPSSYAYGGGLYTTGSLTMINSALANNIVYAASYAQGAGAEVGSEYGAGHPGGSTFAKYSSIIDNHASSSSAITLGGGLYADGDIEMTYSLIADNSGYLGSGVFTVGGPTVTGPASFFDSTVSGNASDGTGGALQAAGTDLSISNTTITANTAAGAADATGAVRVSSGDIALESSIVSGNTAGPGADYADIYTSGTVSGSHNLVRHSNVSLPGDTIFALPMVTSLEYNGGPTATHALRPESVAIDAGTNTESADYDQRGDGYPRVIGASADIGAFEFDLDDLIFANGFD